MTYSRVKSFGDRAIASAIAETIPWAVLSTSFACRPLTLGVDDANSGQRAPGTFIITCGQDLGNVSNRGDQKMVSALLAGLGASVSGILSVVGGLISGLL
jgi:hypothetical protein